MAKSIFVRTVKKMVKTGNNRQKLATSLLHEIA